MNRDQARNLIKTTFTRPFEKAGFRTFTLNLLNRIDESKAQAWNTQYVKDAFKPHVQRYERLGTYTSPSKEKLDVLIVHLTNESKLERTRTAIRNFVADHLKTRDEKEAALVAFVSPTEKQWRFSYVKMDYATVQKESGKIGVGARLTPARRFSYLVGEGESSHTAQSRFVGLLQDTQRDPSLAQIEEAFSVEAVTKEFFAKYAELFEQIEKALSKLVGKDKSIRDEFRAKQVNTVDFAKKLMGQIVFLYFLQKKGWLGVEKGQEWGTGPSDFLRRLANGQYGEYDNFFNDVLEPLFYDTLATDRGHEAWDKRFKCRIPFLNGGLFEPLGHYDWRKTDIILPNKLFTNNDFVEEGITGTGVLDVFDRYNFTVNEAEPLEKEVAIDPEMLGKVFENLIEENRRKGLGSYYTPREIVHYMCQESLINYLDSSVNKDRQLVPRADIETFVHLGEQISHYEAVETEYRVRMPKNIEKNARLIDDKLAEITVCDPAVGSGAFPVGMMTEIVRARTALTPYFNDPHERSAYFFKRHAIQNCLYGVDIDSGAVEIAKLRLWLSLVVDEEDVRQIKPLPNLDYKIVSGNSLLSVEKNLFNADLMEKLETLKSSFFDETDKRKKATLKESIDQLIHHLTNGKETFDFEIYFSEVFHQRRGFDSIIANPPYVSSKELTDKHLYDGFLVAQKQFDLYSLFIERSLNITNTNGVNSLIVPDSLLARSSFQVVRGLLLEQTTLRTILHVNNVFEQASVSSCVYVTLRRAPLPSDSELQYTQAIDVHSWVSGKALMFRLDLRSTKELPEQKILPLSQEQMKLLKRLRSKKKLGQIAILWRGEELGKSSDLITENRSNGTVRILSGDNVGRYFLKGKERFIRKKDVLKDLARYQKKKIVIRQLGDAINATLDDQGSVTTQSIYNLLPKSNSHAQEYMLAVLNSAVVNFIYKSLYAEKLSFPRILLENLKEIPIPDSPITTQRRLCDLVKKILATAINSPGQARMFQREVDRLICELYGLTEDEIKMLESGQ